MLKFMTTNQTYNRCGCMSVKATNFAQGQVQNVAYPSYDLCKSFHPQKNAPIFSNY